MPIVRIASFNRERILWCCQRNQVSIDELAAAIGISSASMEQAFQENAGLTIRQIQNIAEYFHRPLLFFFDDGPVNESQADSPQFRTINDQKPSLARKIRILVKRVEEQRQVFVDLLEALLEHEEDFPDKGWQNCRIEKHVEETVKAFAVRVRDWLGLAEKNSFESYRMALENMGVLVFVSNGYNGRWQIDKDSPVRGFSLYFDEYPVIVVKKQDSPAAQCFTLMHELAHLLLHRASSIDEEQDLHSYKGFEKEANEFAGTVLVPDYLLQGINLVSFPLTEVREYDNYLKRYRDAWGVSGDVIIRRLFDEGSVGLALYREYTEFKSSIRRPNRAGGNRIRYDEPLKIFGALYVGVVFDALHSEQITVNKASKYLDNLKVTDLRQLEQTIAHV